MPNKIVLIIPSLQIGGMERVMSQILIYFSKIPEARLYLILYGIKPDIFYDIPENVTVIRPSFVFDNSRRLWHTLKTIFFLRKTVLKIKPKTILTFGEIWNNLVLISLLGVRAPIFLSDRCRPDISFGICHNFLRKKLYPRAAGIIAQTHRAKEIYLSKHLNPNIHVIGNPIRTIPTKREIKKENIILSVGRLISTKHHDLLIRMFAEINPPNWKLIIIGDDALKQTNRKLLKCLIKKLKLEKKVEMIGSVLHIDDYYLKSKIFAFTSSSEGFPNVIGEALSASLPVIAFDCIAGPSDMVQNGFNGFLIDLYDFDSFKNRLKSVINNEKLRNELAANAPKNMSQFNIDTIGNNYYEFITKQIL